MSRNHADLGQARWERVRQAAFADKGRRCSKCGKAGALEVHHVKPLEQGGTNDLQNLAILCRGCHIAAHRPQPHEREQAWQTLVGEMR